MYLFTALALTASMAQDAMDTAEVPQSTACESRSRHAKGSTCF